MRWEPPGSGAQGAHGRVETMWALPAQWWTALLTARKWALTSRNAPDRSRGRCLSRLRESNP